MPNPLYLVVVVISTLTLCACHLASTRDFIPKPAVDRNGRIDVWQLRRDLAQVESLVAGDNTDHCYSEGGGGEENESPLSESERQRQQLAIQETHTATKACEADVHERYATYKRVQDAFNAAWLPVLQDAVKKGDMVAEVIMRQCDTTPVLDRSRIESSCDEDPQRRIIAAKRLREIGFRPAIDIVSEPGYCEFSSCGSRSPKGREALQEIVLNAFRHGNFGSVHYEATGYWEVKNDPRLEKQLKHNASLIEAARQDVTRAFRFVGRDSESRNEAALKLNRKPSRPIHLTWGPETIRPDGTRLEENHWRSYSNAALCTNNVEFRQMVSDLRNLLRETEDNIAQYLKQDRRWAVFLMQRVGHHEWVPWEQDGASVSHDEFDPLWLGHWELSQTITEFAPPGGSSQGEGSADISRLGGATRITIRTRHPKSPPLRDVADCELRYSGGLTHYSMKGSISHTPLGDADDLGKDANRGFDYKGYNWLNADGKINGLEPLEQDKRYPQVLMQCSDAEMQNNDMVRFLLLAGDTLIEVASRAPACEPLYIRHFKRAKDAKSK